MNGPDETIHVLHVDDEPDFADVAATYLERADDRFQVRSATSPDDGLDALAEHDVDCIVSDYDMPGTNGVEFLEAVRVDDSDLPFILYTGKGSEEVASEAISAGVTDYLQKETGTDQYTILANRIANAVAQTRAEREVTRTREYFGTILEHASDYVMVVDDTGVVQYISPAVERVMGYPPADLYGVEAFEMTHPEDVDEAVTAFAAVFEQPDQEHTVEFRAQHADGSWRWLEVRGRNRIDDPIIEGVVVSVRDITERKARERERRQKERRYQAIFNDPNILVGLIDTDGTVLDINDTALEYIDAIRDDVLDELFWETPWFDHSDDVQEDVRSWIERAREGEYVEFDADLVRHDGESYSIEGVVRPVTNEDGDVVSLLISDRDVTARTTRERELERARDLLEQTERIADVGGWEIDTETMDVFWTDHLFDILGVAYDEEPPLDEALDVYHEADRSTVENAIDRALESAEPFDIEVRFRRPGGEVRWLRIQGTPTLVDGDVETLRGAVQDVTDRKHYERRLEQQNERLNQFTSFLSHDLRTPLNVAEGQLELAREDCESDRLPKIDDALGRIRSLIDDMRTVAQRGQAVTDVHRVDLDSVVQACWDTVNPADAVLETDLTRAIRSDETRLKQAFENLFRNALEHGGADVTVTVGELPDGVYIADDGPGIAESNRDTVFELGYSTAERGTGFGLSIVKQIVEAHGWEIRATSSSEGGARFEITGVSFET